MPSVLLNPTLSGRAFRSGINESFATIRAGAGTGSDVNNDNTPGIRIVATSTSNQYSTNLRTIIEFSLATVLGTISAITLQIYTNSNSTGLGSLDTVVSTSTPASDAGLVNSDYSQVGTTPYSALLNQSAMAAGYSTWTFVAAGITAAQALAGTATPIRLSVQTNNDLTNSGPSWSSGANSNVDFYFSAAGAHPPILTVTFSGGAQSQSYFL